MLRTRRLRLGAIAFALSTLLVGGAVGCAPRAEAPAPEPSRPGDSEARTAAPSESEVASAMAAAEARLSDGDVDGAYGLLLPLSTTVRDNDAFRELYQRTVKAKWPLDARKAHQQHAKEQSGGVLAPEDVWR